MKITQQELNKLLKLDINDIDALRKQVKRILRAAYYESGLLNEQPLEIEEIHEIAKPNGEAYIHDTSYIHKPLSHNINAIHRRYEAQYGACTGPVLIKDDKGQEIQVGYVYTRKEVVKGKAHRHSVFIHFIRRCYEQTFLIDIHTKEPVVFQEE